MGQLKVGANVCNIESDNYLLTKMIEELKTNSQKLTDITLGDLGYFSGKEVLKKTS